MKRNSILFTIFALIIIALGTAGFVDQVQPKKKPQKKAQPTATAEPASITWYTMSEGYAKAKKEKKMIVVDVYTDWCGWCKVMDQKTYGDQTVITKMNKHFVAIKFNPEENGTHIIGNDSMSSDQLVRYLNKGGRMPGYPMTFLWKTISDQKTLAPYSGYIEATQFNGILNTYIQGEEE